MKRLGTRSPGLAARLRAWLHAALLLPLALSLLATVPSAQEAKPDLPDGPGKAILLSACTACHDLTEVTKFRGFYTKDEWRDIVVTMVKYGAVVKEDEVPVLVEYLF